MKVAVDGPAGAGKGTIAKAVAKKNGFVYVDTGALYRAIGLYALRKGLCCSDKAEVIPLLSEITEEMKFKDGEQRVILNGEDVTGLIRTEEVSKAASDVSAILEVRDFLLETQRSISRKYNVIMDGRDIGTFVLPDAELKIFLTASPEIRAERRMEQLCKKGTNVSYEDVLRDIIERDRNDSNRSVRPLKKADDAVIIDNSFMSTEEEVNMITELIEERKCR